jgi:hypothetical protein
MKKRLDMANRLADNHRMARGERITIRVTEEEATLIERAARKEGLAVSEYLRKCILLEQMKEWDHTAMRVIRARIEADVKAALEEHIPIMERKKGA